jgi:hypothetical protein
MPSGRLRNVPHHRCVSFMRLAHMPSRAPRSAASSTVGLSRSLLADGHHCGRVMAQWPSAARAPRGDTHVDPHGAVLEEFHFGATRFPGRKFLRAGPSRGLGHRPPADGCCVAARPAAGPESACSAAPRVRLRATAGPRQLPWASRGGIQAAVRPRRRQHEDVVDVMLGNRSSCSFMHVSG